MKFVIFLPIIFFITASARNLDEDNENDPNFLDPIELPMYQEAIKNMFPNFTDITIESRIVGGNIATSGQFPYTVALHMRQGNQNFICGGALIRFNWVLTAAHCLYRMERVEVIVGAVNRISGSRVFSQTIRNSGSEARDLILHRNYNHRTLANDIALIRLRNARESILNHPNAGVILLPILEDSAVDLTGRNSTVSGFGLTGDGQPPSNVLRFITVPIISNAECARTFGNGVLSSNLCVSTISGRSPCQGDSGGPLTTMLSGNRSVVVGVVSFGSNRCQAGHPVAFARVTSFNDWILRHVNSGNYIRIGKGLGIIMIIILKLVNSLQCT